MNDEDLLNELLLAWVERYMRGEDVPAADFCPERPDLVPILAKRIDLFRKNEGRLNEWLLTWSERHKQGEDVPAAELCPYPELVPILAKWIDIDPLRGMEWLTGAESSEGGLPPSLDPSSEPLAGRFRLDERIGEGGFGQVWRGFDLELQRPVAIKLPRVGHHSAAHEAFRTEARRVAALDCPGIVRVYDVGRHGGVTFIVSELIDGTDLARRLRTGPLPIREAVRVVAEAARHLHHAHQRGLVHRDIKPANLLLDRTGRVFVTDFGIAVTRDELAGRIGNGSGTLPYMSPERLVGAPDRIDARTDVYSLGVVLYELLTGHQPFGADTPAGIRDAILNRDPQFPRSLNRVVERICRKCLAKCQSERYPTAEALADELYRWLHRRAWYRMFFRWFAVVVIGGLLALAAVKIMARSAIPTTNSPNNDPAEVSSTATTPDREEVLFDGSGRHGWAFFSALPEPPGAVGVENGALVLHSVLPQNYRLCSEQTFRDFVLHFEYAFPPDRPLRGNMGCSVLLRVTAPDKTVGGHLHVKFGDKPTGFIVPPGQLLGGPNDVTPLPSAVGVERPFGAWNEMAVTCVGGVVEVSINGRTVNRADGLPGGEGRVGFTCHQYNELRLRNIRVRRLVQ